MKLKKRVVRLFFSLIFLFTLLPVEFAQSESRGSFHFIVLGDSRPHFRELPQARSFKEMLGEINLISPDFVINVGDLIFGYACEEKEVRRQYEDYVSTIKRCLVPYYNVVGNHEIAGEKGEELYEEYLGKLYYSFDYKGSHFIVLDTDINREIGRRGDTGTLGDKQYNWLKEDLKKNEDKENLFVFMHKPMFDDAQASSTCWEDKAERDKVAKLLKEFNVRMVFAGHIHIYRTFMREGITYYISGGGGAETSYPEKGGFYHYLLIKVKDKEVKVEVIEPLHLWVDYSPANDGSQNEVTATITLTLQSSLPLRVRGLTFIMPELGANERYVISPGARIVKVVKNQDKTNTLYVSTFVGSFGQLGVKVVTVQIKEI